MFASQFNPLKNKPLTMKTVLLSALCLILIATAASAQTTTANASQSVTLTLQNQIDIAIVAGSATGTAFTFNSPAEYASGLSNLNASQFQVRSNKAWAVTVAAATANFSGSATTTMPAGKLGVRLASGSSFSQLSTTAASLTSGARGTSTFTVDYNANPGFNYDAGTYTMSVVYTATQQ
jgi:hypothetical protein